MDALRTYIVFRSSSDNSKRSGAFLFKYVFYLEIIQFENLFEHTIQKEKICKSQL